MESPSRVEISKFFISMIHGLRLQRLNQPEAIKTSSSSETTAKCQTSLSLMTVFSLRSFPQPRTCTHRAKMKMKMKRECHELSRNSPSASSRSIHRMIDKQPEDIDGSSESSHANKRDRFRSNEMKSRSEASNDLMGMENYAREQNRSTMELETFVHVSITNFTERPRARLEAND